MNLIIFHSTSKYHYSKNIASKINGDIFEIKHVKKIPKYMFCQMFRFGYETVCNRTVKYHPMDIDFSKYSDIYLVSPVWGSRVDAYMRQFLKDHTFKEMNIHIYHNSSGGCDNYINTIKEFIDDSNSIVEVKEFINGIEKVKVA